MVLRPRLAGVRSSLLAFVEAFQEQEDESRSMASSGLIGRRDQSFVPEGVNLGTE